jgi:signal transduction histidine kinase
VTRTEEAQALDAEAAVHAALALLGDLRAGHQRLEARAIHVEAELCRANDELGRANDELASKVTELERVTRSLEAVLAAIPTGVIVRDEAGRVSHVNQAAAAILGVHGTNVVPGPALRALHSACVDGARAELIGADGRSRIVVRRTSDVVLADGAVVGAVDALDDQTELAAAEDRMRRLTRAAALGTMVGGVAHEVRNPLHAISGFAELLQRELPDDSRAARHAARIRAACADLEAIVASMLGVAGHGRLALERTPVRGIVEAAIEAARASVADGGVDGGERGMATPEITLHVADVVADVDPIELRQALRNLVANALQVQPREPRVLVVAELDADGALVVRVDDAGPGVPAEAREHLFDPFYTTRKSGTGLGLALVRRIAELHGGTLECLAAPSALGGASFRLRIPFSPRTRPLPKVTQLSACAL